MADITKKIGATNTPVTMDYSTLQSWDDAIPANLVTADERWIGECYDQGEFTAGISVTGNTTDSTRNIILRCATGASHAGKGNPLIYNASGGVAINAYCYIDVAHTLFEGLQLKLITGYGIVLDISGGTSVHVIRCIIAGNAGHPLSVVRITANAASNGLIRCVIEQRGNGVGISASGNCAHYYCTLVKSVAASSAGFSAGYDVMVAIGCAVFGFSTIMVGSTQLGAGSDYNASDQSDWDTGANNLSSLTFSDQFVSTTVDFRLKTGASLIGAGTDLGTSPAGVNVDIDGFDVDSAAVAWDIGADHLFNGGGGGGSKLLIRLQTEGLFIGSAH